MSWVIIEKNGVAVEVVRPIDLRLAMGVYADMKEQGWDYDEWPELYERLKLADILAITSPIWLGEKSSICTQVIERLYSTSGPDNDFTNRNTAFMTWNLMHLARLVRDEGGFPAYGNQRATRDAGCRSDNPNPEYR